MMIRKDYANKRWVRRDLISERVMDGILIAFVAVVLMASWT
tara:strand:- start:66 stop:188 length:123 start_codon:yes stop_codon:yes gene_type:complete